MARPVLRILSPPIPHGHTFAAIWPHVRPIGGTIFVAADGDPNPASTFSELRELWAGPISLVESKDAHCFASLTLSRPWARFALSKQLIPLLSTLREMSTPGGSVAMLLPLSVLRVHALRWCDWPPDIWPLPSLHEGKSKAWFAWGSVRGANRDWHGGRLHSLHAQ